jgi:hypothetical protein
MVNLIVRLARSLRSQIIGVVSPQMAICEFESKQTECRSADWNECRRAGRRLVMTAARMQSAETVRQRSWATVCARIR